MPRELKRFKCKVCKFQWRHALMGGPCPRCEFREQQKRGLDLWWELSRPPKPPRDGIFRSKGINEQL